ncbi:MAG TPA: hypothetical protein VGM82_02750 [Gemmatimonadaceae bacterium]
MRILDATVLELCGEFAKLVRLAFNIVANGDLFADIDGVRENGRHVTVDVAQRLGHHVEEVVCITDEADRHFHAGECLSSCINTVKQLEKVLPGRMRHRLEQRLADGAVAVDRPRCRVLTQRDVLRAFHHADRCRRLLEDRLQTSSARFASSTALRSLAMKCALSIASAAHDAMPSASFSCRSVKRRRRHVRRRGRR